MSALTANRPTTQVGGVSGPVVERIYVPIADDVHIFAGAQVQVHGGFAYPAGTANTADTHLYVTVGRSNAEYDNTVAGHASGAFLVEIATGCFLWDNSGTDALAATDAIAACYAEDDHTVAKTSNSSALAKAGVYLGLDAATGMCRVQTLLTAGSL